MSISAETNLPTVLIIDDDPESLLLVSTMVEYVGYRPIVAATFEEASAAFQQGPESVVLDLVMPDRTSERFAELLLSEGSAIPIILMSALKRDRLGGQAAAYARSGINVVSTLSKPFWIDALLGALEQAIPHAPSPALVHD